MEQSQSVEKNSVLPTASAHALSDRQLLAIPLLLEGKTAIAAAEQIGIDPETLRRWVRTDEAFIAEYEAQRTLAYNTRLQKAFSKLDAHLDNTDWKPQQGAAGILLKHHADMARANSTVTHTIILDKIRDAMTGTTADAIDAEYTELATCKALPAEVEASESNPGAIEGDCEE